MRRSTTEKNINQRLVRRFWTGERSSVVIGPKQSCKGQPSYAERKPPDRKKVSPTFSVAIVLLVSKNREHRSPHFLKLSNQRERKNLPSKNSLRRVSLFDCKNSCLIHPSLNRLHGSSFNRHLSSIQTTLPKLNRSRSRLPL